MLFPIIKRSTKTKIRYLKGNNVLWRHFFPSGNDRRNFLRKDVEQLELFGNAAGAVLSKKELKTI
jgi:hypothetical protein